MLKLYFDYILKVLALPDHRLPKILVQELISKNICWWKEWLSLFRKHEVECNQKLMERIITQNQNGRCSLRSKYHGCYPKLKKNCTDPIYYLNIKLNQKFSKTIFKTFKTIESKFCTMERTRIPNLSNV